MRASGTGITDALTAAPSVGLAPRQFVWIVVKRRDDGTPVSFGFWNGLVPITINVISALTGLAEERIYEPGALVAVDKVKLTVGLRYRPWSFTLDKNAPRVRLALREYDPRLGLVEYHRVPLAITSRRPAAAPRCRFFGQIDGTQFTRPQANGEGGVVVSCLGATAELTKTSPAKRSLTSTQKRSNDKHARYVDTCHNWDIRWGEGDAGTEGTPSGNGPGRGWRA